MFRAILQMILIPFVILSLSSCRSKIDGDTDKISRKTTGTWPTVITFDSTQYGITTMVRALIIHVADTLRLHATHQKIDTVKSIWEKVSTDSSGVSADFVKIQDYSAFDCKDTSKLLYTEYHGDGDCTGDSMKTVYHANENVFSEFDTHRSVFYFSQVNKCPNGIRMGMSQDEVIAILGKPYRQLAGLITYGVLDAGSMHHNQVEMYKEDIRMYFLEGKLNAIWIEWVTDC